MGRRAGRPRGARAVAAEIKARTYAGAVHVNCGTREKYTSNGGCVHCSLKAAAQQRSGQHG